MTEMNEPAELYKVSGLMVFTKKLAMQKLKKERPEAYILFVPFTVNV